MSLDPFKSYSSWNYSKTEDPTYSANLIGTVVAVQQVQKVNFMTKEPEFWSDTGRPMMNIRLSLVTEDGNIKTFTFQPQSKSGLKEGRQHVQTDLYYMTGANNAERSMNKLVGMTIEIWTEPGQYGQGHPRPFYAKPRPDIGPFMTSCPIPAELTTPELLANNAASGGQMNHPMQAQPQVQAQPVMQAIPAAQVQPQPQPMVAPQPVVAQPQPTQYIQPQPAPAASLAPQAQPVQPMQEGAMPVGMDPAVAAAMQSVGAQNVSPYEGDIPF